MIIKCPHCQYIYEKMNPFNCGKIKKCENCGEDFIILGTDGITEHLEEPTISEEEIARQPPTDPPMPHHPVPKFLFKIFSYYYVFPPLIFLLFILPYWLITGEFKTAFPTLIAAVLITAAIILVKYYFNSKNAKK